MAAEATEVNKKGKNWNKNPRHVQAAIVAALVSINSCSNTA